MKSSKLDFLSDSAAEKVHDCLVHRAKILVEICNVRKLCREGKLDKEARDACLKDLTEEFLRNNTVMLKALVRGYNDKCAENATTTNHNG